MQIYLFERVNQFLLLAEELLITQARSNKFSKFQKVQRFLFFPIEAIRQGVKELSKGIFLWVILTLIGRLIFAFLEKISDQFSAKFDAYPAWSAIAIIIALLVTFVAPSSYGPDSKSRGTIEKLVQLLKDCGFQNAEHIELLKKQIALNEIRVRSHVAILKWFSALPWAALLYCLSKFIDLLLAKEVEHANTFFNYSIPLMFIVFIITSCVFGYERSINRFYQLIELACCEIEFELTICNVVEKNKPSSQTTY